MESEPLLRVPRRRPESVLTTQATGIAMITPPQAWHHHDYTCGITMMPLPGITMMPFSEDISRQKGRHTAAAILGRRLTPLKTEKQHHQQHQHERRTT